MKPEQLSFAQTHEWVAIESAGGGRTATVGISAFAVESLTDLVYIELPEVGSTVKPGEPFGQIESVKAVSDLYSPVGGEIVAVNADLAKHLEILNTDPYTKGWMIKVKLSGDEGLADLMDHAAYQRQCAEEGH